MLQLFVQIKGRPSGPTNRPARFAAGPHGLDSALRETLVAALFYLLSVAAQAAPTVDWTAAVAPESRANGPGAVFAAFDSLLEAGRFEEARHLCTGQVLRMFDFIASTQARLTGLVDTAQSTEKQVGEGVRGDWAFVKVASHTVFKKPLLGQREIRSVQAVHFHRSPKGWRIAEFEELENADTPVQIRSGTPRDAAAAAALPGVPAPGLFPASRLAPAAPVEADWMKYRLQLRNGGSLEAFCPLDRNQRRLQALSPDHWILENRKAVLPTANPTSASKLQGPVHSAPVPDSLAAYLASNAYLVLEDSLLKATAGRIGGAAVDHARIARAVYAWVSREFRFQLGAVLFGTSREVLRGMTGDCSEAAILTAALLRSKGVPARIALGFASVGGGVFIGHAWTEAWLGEWVGVDAALRQFPAGVERVKLAELDGRADMRVSATNLMMAVLSNLDIEILEMRKGGRKITLKAYPGNVGEGAKFFQEILKGIDSTGVGADK